MIDLLRFGAPVALGALGETVSQKAGVINIGLEGMMLSGAFVAMWVTLKTQNPWLGLLAGMIVGFLLAWLAGWFVITQGADQVVVGTAVNLAALGLTGALFRQMFGQSGQLLSLPELPKMAFGLDAVLIFLLLSVPVLTYLLYRTQWGLALRACGEYPPAVESAGFQVHPLRQQALWIGGIYAGLAGAYLSVGIAASFQENMTSGRGFIAIAMVTFGRFKPVWAFAASLVIGFAEILQFQLQARGFQFPAPVMLALPYLLALMVLIFVGKGARVPRALAVPYRKEKG